MHDQETYSGHKTYYSKKWRDTDNKRDACKTVDNIYRHEWNEVKEKYPAVIKLMDEKEFTDRKAAYETSNKD